MGPAEIINKLGALENEILFLRNRVAILTYRLDGVEKDSQNQAIAIQAQAGGLTELKCHVEQITGPIKEENPNQARILGIEES